MPDPLFEACLPGSSFSTPNLKPLKSSRPQLWISVAWISAGILLGLLIVASFGWTYQYRQEVRSLDDARQEARRFRSETTLIQQEAFVQQTAHPEAVRKIRELLTARQTVDGGPWSRSSTGFRTLLLGNNEGLHERESRLARLQTRSLAVLDSLAGEAPGVSLVYLPREQLEGAAEEETSPEFEARRQERYASWGALWQAESHTLNGLNAWESMLNAQESSLWQRYTTGQGLILMALLCVAVFLLLLFRRRYIRPLNFLLEHFQEAEKINEQAAGPLQPVAKQWNEIQEAMGLALQVAGAVGKGDFDYQVPEHLREQSLGSALVDMGQRLRQVDEEDRIRNWSSEGLNRFGEIFRAEQDHLRSLSQKVIDALVEYLEANQGVIYILRKGDLEEPDYLEAVAAYAWGFQQLVEERFLLNEGPVGAAVYANRVIYMTDLPDDYVRIKSGLGDAQPRNILITPLRVNEEVIGAIEIASFRLIKEHEVAFMEQLGRNLASTIHGVIVRSHTETLLEQSQELAGELAKREQEILSNVQELESAKGEMEQKQSELDGLLSSVDRAMAMMEIGPEGHIQESNTHMLDMLGYEAPQLRGQHIARLFEVGEGGMAFWEDLMRGRSFNGELKYMTRQGQEIWVQATYSPILGQDGSIKKVVHLATDTTETKLAAIHYEGHYQAINQTAGTMEMDPNGTILAVNEQYLKMLGYSAEELTGARHRILVPEEELRGGVDNEIWNTVRAGHSLDGQFRLLRKDGKEKWIRGSYSPIRDLNGKVVRAVHIATDISGQKRMEMRIKEQLEQMASQEEELRQNMEEMQATHEEMERNQAEMNGILGSIDRSMAMVTYDLEGQLLSANNSFLELLRFTDIDLQGLHLKDLFTSDEQEEGVPESLLRELVKGQHRTGEFRFQMNGGKSIWLNSTFNPVLDRHGEVQKIIQFATAASVEIEAQLKAIQESNAMMMIDREGKILEANKVFGMYLGFDPKDMEGRNIAEFIPEGGHMGMDAKTLLAHLGAGKHLEGEFSIKAQTEEAVWIRGAYHPIQDLSGESVKVLLAGINVSEEKVMADRIGAQLTQMSRQRSELRKNIKELEKTKQTVEEREAEMRGQLEAINSTNGLVEFKMDGYILKANANVAEMLGYATPAEMEGVHFKELFIVGEGNLDFWDELQTGNTQSGDYRWKTVEGKEVWIDATFTPVTDREGKAAKVLTLLTNISDRKEKEKQIIAANEKLNQTLNELTTTQDQLILSEKMASLGQLIASVAHEVNTPISAVKASVRNMARVFPELIRDLPSVLAEAEPELQELFMKLVETSLRHNKSLTTKEERAFKKTIYDFLDENGIENAFSIAGKLVELRLFDNIEPFLPLIEHPDAEALLALASKVGHIKLNIDNIETAAGKTSKIVFALKSYTHVQNVDHFVDTDLAASLDLILTVYENQLKYGIEVHKQYQDVPEVPVYPDELGQVWTNIIHNAIQAMNNRGSLKIGLRKEGDLAVVRITDSGPGIPPDIQKRIFDPFFTTKAQGEGTGLGLDICRKIIEKHHGRIEVESAPGKTTFAVFLPFEHPEELPTEGEASQNETQSSLEAVAPGV